MTARLTVLAMALVVSSGCDPCAGTVSCEGDPRVGVVGQIRDPFTGTPINGATITAQSAGGIAIVPSTVQTRSGDGGTFELVAGSSTEGGVLLDITVDSPGQVPYTVTGVAARATRLRGEGTTLGPWVAWTPNLPYVLELFFDGTADVRVMRREIVFRRTAGGRIFKAGVEQPIVVDTTNDIGWVLPFEGMTTDGAGRAGVTGDLIVRLTATDSVVFAGLHFEGVATFAPQLGLVRLAVGAP